MKLILNLTELLYILDVMKDKTLLFYYAITAVS